MKWRKEPEWRGELVKLYRKLSEFLPGFAFKEYEDQEEDEDESET